MRKLLVLFFILSLNGFAFSEEAKPAEQKPEPKAEARPEMKTEMKMGFVDLQHALNESDRGKSTKTALESLIREKNSLIDEKIKAKEKLREDFEKQAGALSEKAKKAKFKELDEMEKEIDRLIDGSQAEIQRIQKNMEDEILNELGDVVDKLGEAEKFTLIFPAGVLLYSSEKAVDLTDAVIQKYNTSKTQKKTK